MSLVRTLNELIDQYNNRLSIDDAKICHGDSVLECLNNLISIDDGNFPERFETTDDAVAVLAAQWVRDHSMPA